MKEKKRFIAVIGGSDCTPEEARLAEEVGRELARKDAILVCGGLGGVMEAACRGASAGGGLTIGILPGGSRQTANPYVQIPVVTNLGEARNVIVVKSAEAVIAIGGGYGTLSEIGHALRNGIPVVGLNTWSLSRNDRPDNSIVLAKNPVDAVNKALNMVNN
ncbi:MAG: TIGR00725 family protein [Dehalococcoidia bacterium]|nr:MAG: TIGR00725 family protein [Dehalococcoidia bacterium]